MPSGKTIGVISHVEAMKERIPVQIKVKKINGLGYSKLEKCVCSEITIQQDNEYRGANYLLASLVVILQAITLLATVIGSRSGGCDGGMKKLFYLWLWARLVWGWPNLALWACSRSWRIT